MTGDHCGLDTVLRTLADHDRRRVLTFFDGSGVAEAHVDELAAYLRSKRADPADAAWLEAKLHHVDLPVLTAAGALDFDSESGTVRYRPDERWTRALARVAELETLASCTS